MLIGLLQQQAAIAPVLLTIEDLHWADPSTREFIGMLAGAVPTSRICCVLTSRPEEPSAWWDHPWHSTISLSRLGVAETEALVEKLVEHHSIPVGIAREIVRRTDGIPLFVEEMTKAVIENLQSHTAASHHGGQADLDHVAIIPATLRESLMARLDRMVQGKSVAQIGATIGREFSYQLLHAI